MSFIINVSHIDIHHCFKTLSIIFIYEGLKLVNLLNLRWLFSPWEKGSGGSKFCDLKITLQVNLTISLHIFSFSIWNEISNITLYVSHSQAVYYCQLLTKAPFFDCAFIRENNHSLQLWELQIKIWKILLKDGSNVSTQISRLLLNKALFATFL